MWGVATGERLRLDHREGRQTRDSGRKDRGVKQRSGKPKWKRGL